ncbi:PD-(D/E)XK nuclease family protein [Halobacterium salinarum]|uniref:PD-(D/E)XK nuclease family protein n=1 Tax=Halobacterium salinarum TaxID=2242 RepID=UPI00255226BA|nr:PD-(D/E)XK nuclease family protein [Halobacterium salinarum]MDL0130989.1 PD-(D/E)XK nuclease family protein [Halobacterium salinarum]
MKNLESRLAEFGNAINGLSEASERPKTAFELLNKGRYEDAWQSYLRYFLAPDEPHQLEGEFLNRFFDLLERNEMISFSPPETGLQSGQGVEITAERQSSGDNRPDLIVTSGSEWFLCIELKVHSSEGGGEDPQTARYANDENIVPNGVAAYEDGDFIYIKPGDAAGSSSPTFSDLSWHDVQSVIENTLAHSTGYVPARSIAQLSDFSTLIDSQLAMTDIDEETRQRKDLYFEYRDEITEARNAIEPFVKTILQQNWAQALEESFQPRNAHEMEWQYGAIGNGYGQVRTHRWEVAKSGPEKLDIHWEHKPTQDDFMKGQLRFILEPSVFS